MIDDKPWVGGKFFHNRLRELMALSHVVESSSKIPRIKALYRETRIFPFSLLVIAT